MKRIMITGVADFLGHHIAHHFLSLGHTVLGTDLIHPSTIFAAYPSTQEECIVVMRMARLYQYPNFNYVTPTDGASQVASRFGPDVILHFSGHLRRGSSLLLNGAANDLTDLTESISIANDVGAERIIYASSASLYELGSAKDVSQAETTMIQIPHTLYPYSKWLCEQYAKSVTNDINITGLRIFSAYGPLSRTNMIPWQFAKASYYGGDMEVYHNCTRDFVHIQDICNIIGMLIYKDSLPPILNIGTGISTPIGNIADIARVMGKNGLTSHCSYMDHINTHLKADTTLLNSVLKTGTKSVTEDYKFIPLQKGMIDTFKAHHNLMDHIDS